MLHCCGNYVYDELVSGLINVNTLHSKPCEIHRESELVTYIGSLIDVFMCLLVRKKLAIKW